MKILFISSWFPNRQEPTNGNFVQRHAEAVALLHEVEILHAIGDPHQEEELIFEDQMINGIRTLIVYYRGSRNPVLNFRNRMNAYQKGFSELKKPDLVHANILHNSMFFAVYLKEKFRIPFVVSEHWSGFLPVNRFKLSVINILTARYIGGKASYIFPVSKVLMNNLKDLKIGKNSKVVGNVVDTELFVPQKLKNNIFTFLHISNLIALKNPDAIINAAVRLRKEFENFELHIGGDGDVERLDSLILKYNGKEYIKTFAEIAYQEVAEKMRQSDCFVLFSDYESFSCVLLESLSSGVPVIATRVGAIPEIINENQGIIIDKSEEELYMAMKNMLCGNHKTDSPEALHQYVVDNFSIPAIAKQFSEVYKSIV
ncbi:glycosyltransferase [Chryseobacterium capnotolerans]|uniref:glycosyltransferase n=1 Tax=Chryseobacterium TaxID=59732 RepID=UPI00083AC3AB|nr:MULTISPECIES: glycosyltransferase [Chryseobacterium]UHO38535.1 glycosyltransferase [Chryseobacterium capnotolerans]